jgi:hypothetical protein
MEYIKRKVYLNKYLTPFDSNGDGVLDSIVISATTKTLQIPLIHSYDDMGIFEVSDEESFEIIEVSSLFNDTITDDDIKQLPE